MMILNKIFDYYNRWKQRKSSQEFAAKPLAERARTIKKIYSFEKTKDRYIGFFEAGIDIRNNVQLFFDVVTGVCKDLKPATVRQIGCWTGTESKFLVDAGFKGVIQATDFDGGRIDFLKKHYETGPYSQIDFFVQDIENLQDGEFEGVNAVVAQAVLSNIQPEYLEVLLGRISKENVDLVLIGDCYTKETLGLAEEVKSVISPVDFNWFHPFLSLGKRYGYEVLFVPDFMYSSFHVARGVFILHRNYTQDQISQSMAHVYQNYFARQEGVLKHYEGVDMNKPYEIESED